MEDRIIRYFHSGLSETEKKELISDCRKDKHLYRQLLEYKNTMAMMELYPSENTGNIGKERLNDFLSKHAPAHQKKRGYRLRFYHYAAIITLLLASAFWLTYYNYSNLQDVEMVYNTSNGVSKELMLPDGSKVWLNAGSTLVYHKGIKNKREVHLTGEGYFEVKKSSKRFVVHAGKMVVSVLGTHFNVASYNADSPIVALLEGSVRVEAGTKSAVLKPDQKAIVQDGEIEVSPTEYDPTSWIRGVYIFNRQTLGAIIKELSIYYDCDIHIASDELREQVFTGKFRKREGIENCLQLLQKTHHFNIRKEVKEKKTKYLIY